MGAIKAQRHSDTQTVGDRIRMLYVPCRPGTPLLGVQEEEEEEASKEAVKEEDTRQGVTVEEKG